MIPLPLVAFYYCHHCTGGSPCQDVPVRSSSSSRESARSLSTSPQTAEMMHDPLVGETNGCDAAVLTLQHDRSPDVLQCHQIFPLLETTCTAYGESNKYSASYGSGVGLHADAMRETCPDEVRFAPDSVEQQQQAMSDSCRNTVLCEKELWTPQALSHVSGFTFELPFQTYGIPRQQDASTSSSRVSTPYSGAGRDHADSTMHQSQHPAGMTSPMYPVYKPASTDGLGQRASLSALSTPSPRPYQSPIDCDCDAVLRATNIILGGQQGSIAQKNTNALPFSNSSAADNFIPGRRMERPVSQNRSTSANSPASPLLPRGEQACIPSNGATFPLSHTNTQLQTDTQIRADRSYPVVRDRRSSSCPKAVDITTNSTNSPVGGERKTMQSEQCDIYTSKCCR